jgi:hypothetical protein
MKIEDNELAEGTVLPDERVATFEQLLDEKSELELTETMATVCGIHTARSLKSLKFSAVIRVQLGSNCNRYTIRSWSLGIHALSLVVVSSIFMLLNHSQKLRSGYSKNWTPGLIPF